MGKTAFKLDELTAMLYDLRRFLQVDKWASNLLTYAQ